VICNQILWPFVCACVCFVASNCDDVITSILCVFKQFLSQIIIYMYDYTVFFVFLKILNNTREI